MKWHFIRKCSKYDLQQTVFQHYINFFLSAARYDINQFLCIKIDCELYSDGKQAPQPNFEENICHENPPCDKIFKGNVYLCDILKIIHGNKIHKKTSAITIDQLPLNIFCYGLWIFGIICGNNNSENLEKSQLSSRTLA